MNDIQKVALQSDGTSMHLTMPISKIDEEKRTVSGFASLDNIDKQGDKITSEANRKAFSGFRGNVRLMHQPIPAGRVTSFEERKYYDPDDGTQYTGVYVNTYVSKGAQDIWEMVLDRTLTGFSIGGAIKDYDVEYDEATGNSVRVITDYDLVELSLVDSPANQLANIFSIEKTENGNVMRGMLSKTNVQNVFWCRHDRKAYTNAGETMQCPFCETEAVSIGWVETDSPAEMSKSIQLLIDKRESATEGGTNMSDVDNVEKTDVVDEVVEPAVETTEVEKTDAVEEQSSTETVVEKAPEFDFEKSFAAVLDRLEAIEKSLIEYTEKMQSQFTATQESVEKTVNDFAEVAEKAAKVEVALQEQATAMKKVAERVENVEADTALRKSVEVEALPETTTGKKSLWAGSPFLNTGNF